VRRFFAGMLVGVLVTAVLGSGDELESAVRFGIFGISGIIPDKAYFTELPLDVGTSGFWLGPSMGFFGSNKEELHTRQMREFVEYGLTPIATFYLGNVGPAEAEAAEAIVRYYTAGNGVDDVGVPVTYWELGDEQNGGWGTSCDPREYARRVSILAPAIRAACPSCSVVMGGLLDGPGMGDWALEPYFRSFLEAGGAEWIDVYAFHYYGLARPDAALPGAQLYDSAIPIVETMRGLMDAFGVGDRPIWVTETCTFSGGMGSIEQSESDQAADLVKRYVLLWSLDVAVAQWCYLTEPQYEGTGVGFFDQSGLVYDGEGPYDRGAGVRKRAYFAYQNLVQRLRGAELLGLTTTSGVTVARFALLGVPITLLWQDPWVRQGAVWVTPCAEIGVEGLCGESLGCFDAPFRLDLTMEPVYLLGAEVGVSLSAPALAPAGP